MKKVDRIIAFPTDNFIAPFTGKTIDDAIKNAEDEANRHPELEFQCYFEQPTYGKSSKLILVSYRRR